MIKIDNEGDKIIHIKWCTNAITLEFKLDIVVSNICNT